MSYWHKGRPVGRPHDEVVVSQHFKGGQKKSTDHQADMQRKLKQVFADRRCCMRSVREPQEACEIGSCECPYPHIYISVKMTDTDEAAETADTEIDKVVQNVMVTTPIRIVQPKPVRYITEQDAKFHINELMSKSFLEMILGPGSLKKSWKQVLASTFGSTNSSTYIAYGLYVYFRIKVMKRHTILPGDEETEGEAEEEAKEAEEADLV